MSSAVAAPTLIAGVAKLENLPIIFQVSMYMAGRRESGVHGDDRGSSLRGFALCLGNLCRTRLRVPPRWKVQYAAPPTRRSNAVVGSGTTKILKLSKLIRPGQGFVLLRLSNG